MGKESQQKYPGGEWKFADLLRHERENSGVSQEIISGLCGISRQMWGRYENGESEPNLETLVTIADYFGVSMDYLAGRTNKKHVNKSWQY